MATKRFSATGSKGGEDLSAGQWQRIAHPRAHCAAKAPLVILDEPTSALDAIGDPLPLARAQIFAAFEPVC